MKFEIEYNRARITESFITVEENEEIGTCVKTPIYRITFYGINPYKNKSLFSTSNIQYEFRSCEDAKAYLKLIGFDGKIIEESI